MITELLERYPNLIFCKADILRAKEALIRCYEKKGKLLLCGNGGSAADCEHIVGELMKGFMSKRPLSSTQREKMSERCEDLRDETLSKLQNALPAISLTSFNSLNTAFSNDVDADLVFAQSVFGLGKTNDVLIAISTSGNSKNVLEAARVARSIGLKVIALTGRGGGALARIADVTIRVPEDETYRIQELHLPVYHYLCAEIEKYFFG
jgi:D-sedoheptulose 7-phosphate isomerase